MASSSDSLSSRANPFIASAGEIVYLWGGQGDTEPQAIFMYQCDKETWMRQLTVGQHPPTELNNGGCTTSGNLLYLYGGSVGRSYYGDLYELNTLKWRWRKVCEGGFGKPGKKSGCRMISYQNQLLVVGGLYEGIPNSTQAGASYEGGWTNEVHSYNLITGKEIE